MSLNGLIDDEKWICIKTFNMDYKWNKNGIQKIFQIGDVITFKVIDNYDMVSQDIWGSYHEFLNKAHIIQLQPWSAFIRHLTIKELKDNFIKLAELRAKRIDEILEDE
jgi:hypothetical protein